MPAEFIVVINPRIRLNFKFYFDANFVFSTTDMSAGQVQKKDNNN